MSTIATGEVVTYDGGTWFMDPSNTPHYEHCYGANFLILDAENLAVYQGEDHPNYVWALHLDRKMKMLIMRKRISKFGE